MIFHCCERRRLEVLRRSSTNKNAIEFLEVLDHAAPPGVEPQRTLFVRLLRAPPVLTAANVSITGGERIPTIGIEWVAHGGQPAARPPSRASSMGSTNCRARWWFARPRAATFRATPSRSSRARAAASRRPTSIRCSSSHRFLLQGGVPVGFRLRRAARLRAGAGGNAAHRLPRQGLRGIPAPDAGSPEPVDAGLDASAPLRISVSRWSSCWPTPPTT